MQSIFKRAAKCVCDSIPTDLILSTAVSFFPVLRLNQFQFNSLLCFFNLSNGFPAETAGRLSTQLQEE